jgi:hypothetical protein
MDEDKLIETCNGVHDLLDNVRVDAHHLLSPNSW